ncbi:MAG: MFS transporter [Pseudomonadales bacterium]|nr:MFS transporter [Pseudomonadales bacterium]
MAEEPNNASAPGALAGATGIVDDKVSASSWYALGLLLVVYVFNFLDRSILGILAQPIKEELGVSDTEMGFLGGIAFALFYTILGIPIARLADKTVRRTLLAICLALWSVMTVLCGFATSFTYLLVARIGVSIGEAGGSPPSHSMISDLFPEHRRATALSIYALGIPIGAMLGSLIGGTVNAEYGWRVAFIVVGIPGILLALLVRFTLTEPVRGASETIVKANAEAPPVMDVMRFLWARRSFRYLALGAALHAFVGNGVGYWFPSFLIRSHGLDTATVGLWLFYLGFAGMIGTFLGGYICDRLGKRDDRWYLWLPGLATVLAIPFSVYVYLGDDVIRALFVANIPVMLGAFYLGPGFALTQRLVGVRMRALAASVLLFVTNLIGLGLGPQLTGIISDVLHATTALGVDSLRWSMVSVLGLNVISTLFYLIAAKYLIDDLKAPK